MPDAAGLRMLARPDRLQVGPWKLVYFYVCHVGYHTLQYV